jgi:hypothetical protein
MKYSFFSRIRDILFFCALLFLMKIVFERATSYIKLHKDSMIHELDIDFVDQIYTAQRQLHALEEHPAYALEYADDIAEIKRQLTTIEEKYKKNSPGLVLLGPIGSAAIVVKEKELEQKLLTTVNKLSRVFASINNTPYSAEATKGRPEEFTAAQTINCALNTNKEILRTLIV